MTKRAIVNIIISVFCVMILSGAGIANYVAERNQNVIKVDLTEGEAESVGFESLSLVPGESCEYRLKLNSDISGACNFTVSFSDKAPEATLKRYVRVSLEMNGEIISDSLLEALLNGEDVCFKSKLSDGKNEIKVRYYIPEDVGNEAQNAEASFEMLIKVENE